jgi:hypothetical protein
LHVGEPMPASIGGLKVIMAEFLYQAPYRLILGGIQVTFIGPIGGLDSVYLLASFLRHVGIRCPTNPPWLWGRTNH